MQEGKGPADPRIMPADADGKDKDKDQDKDKDKGKGRAHTPGKRRSQLQLTHKQETGVQWMLARESDVEGARGGVLADEAGSGKSAMLVALMQRAPLWPTLLLVPCSLVHTWVDVMRRWAPGLALRVLTSGGSARSLDMLMRAALDRGLVQVVIAPHSCLAQPLAIVPGLLRTTTWGRIIIDEAHVIKNPSSLTHRTACALHAAARWAVTATPVQNHEGDLLALAKFVGTPFQHGADARAHLVLHRLLDNPRSGGPSAVGDADADAAGDADADVALRRPGLSVSTVYVDLSEDERARYEWVRRTLQPLEPPEGGAAAGEQAEPWEGAPAEAEPPSHVLQLELRLRCAQACTHASLMYDGLARSEWLYDSKGAPREGVDPGWCALQAAQASDALPDEGAFGSAKLARLAEDVGAAVRADAEAGDAGGRCLVFCDWHAEMELVRRLLAARLPRAAIILFHGRMSLEEREDALWRFRQPRGGGGGSSAAVLVMQTRCGGCGLNLQAATHLFFLRPHFNPAVEYQAIARAYRRGQTRPVHVARYVAANTVDEAALQCQDRKRASIAQLLGELPPALRGDTHS